MEKHNTSGHIKQIAMSGILVALAVIMSFAHFTIGGGNVYLIGIVVFLMPLCLRFPYMLISAISSVVICDLITGWIAFTWISIIAYGGAVIIIWASTKLRFGFIFIGGLIIGSIYAVTIYYLLESSIDSIGHSIAVKDAIATSIQFAIVIPITSLLYFPLKLIMKPLGVIIK